VNPADQIEAIVLRAVSTLRSMERRHRAEREAAAERWRDPDVADGDDDRDTADEAVEDDRSRPVLDPAQIAAISDAADE
jgi:hypothetical protein